MNRELNLRMAAVLSGRASLKELHEVAGGKLVELWEVTRCSMTNRKILTVRVAIKPKSGQLLDVNVPAMATLPTYCDEATLARYVRLLRVAI